MEARMNRPPESPMQSMIDEQTAMDAFHKFLSIALAQAKAERLLDEETLASAEADLMVAGTEGGGRSTPRNAD